MDYIFLSAIFFYIIIIILFFYNLIKIRVISRMKIFATNITGLIIIIIHNRNSRRGGSLVFFYNLFGILKNN
jgi:hypothetical protein